MKRMIYWFVPVMILVFACNLPTATVSTATDTPTVSTATNTPTVTLTPTVAPNVTCNELTLTLDPALASSFNCQTIPAAGSPSDPGFAVNPQFTQVTLQGYLLAGTFFKPNISVYPVQNFHTLAPDIIDANVAALQQLIAGGALPAKGALPLLPISNSMLPPNGDNPPNGLTWDQFGNQFDTYIPDLTDKLNNQPPESYSPTIAVLDALITGINIQP